MLNVENKVITILKELRKEVLTSDTIAKAVLYAVSQPDDVDVNEVIVRPIRQMM